ncbi:NAD-dependent aldehyde dehydrogenase [Leptolyngbya sp. 'hensonii']|uniref:aldehyde dehydrogenase family protein n=1 Tax=Leptolyngbya sp. 'hensonii' TaxID=1922337 RepID=UPI00095023D2|nr:aldehyde dehydrogenase family protein [Leptolyngbya sp. 'hensonii']OLP18202.1 NAD-dependent aldehyde dehydrogenase [Leptolyngbya sp. 'hensonii']
MASSRLPVSTFAEVDVAIALLCDRKMAWARLSIPDRITYLQRCIEGVLAVAEDWVEASCQLKAIDPASPLAGEEWIAGPCSTVSNLRLLMQTLQAQGQPQPVRWTTRPDGQSVAQVFPDNLMDQVLWLGFQGEVWSEPGQPATQGQIYRESSPVGRVALVLGAGNISSIAPMDSLYKLFVENQVVLLKMNPVNQYMGPILEQAFQSLRADGFFEVVYGAADLGHYLCHHPQIETVHITGSHHTHDAIVWGSTPEERQERQASQRPLLTKPITSELGNITPILVVPGSWSGADLAFQARHVAAMVAHNASFNCVAGKVLVVAAGWPQREAFLTRLRQELARTPARKAYYPGAQQRYQAFLDRYPQAEAIGNRIADSVPWTLIPDVVPVAGEYALQEEPFCGVLAQVTLPATTAAEFLHQATEFANGQIWGSLACALLIHPRTQKQYADELEQAIAKLRYGSVAVNVWPGMIYYFSVHSWGAFPGNSLGAISSGRGVVHNAYLFDHPQKSVMWAPFRIWPTPAWFADNRNLKQLAQRYLQYEAKPTWDNVLRVVLAAVRG